MILTCDVIRREIEAGRVVIEPFFADQVGPASIDLHLGDEIRVMHTGREPVPVTEDVDYRMITDVRSLETPYPLAPGRDHPRHHPRAHHAAQRHRRMARGPHGSRASAS